MEAALEVHQDLVFGLPLNLRCVFGSLFSYGQQNLGHSKRDRDVDNPGFGVCEEDWRSCKDSAVSLNDSRMALSLVEGHVRIIWRL